MSRRVSDLIAAGAAALALGTAPALAQPVNDQCANAVALTPSTPTAGTTVGADLQLASTCTDAGEVWYSFTTPASGAYLFTVAAADTADVTLSVFTGCDFPIGISGCEVGTGGPTVNFEYQSFFAGEFMVLRVGSVSGAGQPFTITAGPLPPPANDECSGAVPLTLGVASASSNLSATTSFELTSAEACQSIAPGYTSGADVFFSFTPDVTGFYDFSTCGAVFDTIVSVHAGCPASPANQIACNDNAPLIRCEAGIGGTYASYVSGAALDAGVTYYVRVAGVKSYDPFSMTLGDPGRSPFSITVNAGQDVQAPTNDTCAGALPIAQDGFINGSTVKATGEPGLACLNDDYFDVWYSFTSASAERRVFDFTITPQTSFGNQCTMSLYTACGGPRLTCQAYNALTRPDMTITALLNPGETAYLRVAGTLGAQDEFQIVAITGVPAATNTDCASAAALTADTPVNVDTTLAPSVDPGPCEYTDDVYSLWYSFTAPQTGYYRFATDFPEVQGGSTVMSVYPACGVGQSVCTTQGDDQSVNPAAAATAVHMNGGEVALLRVAKTGAQRGQFTLVAQGPLPAPPTVTNDTCATAQTVTSAPFDADVNITLATPDAGLCVFQGDPAQTSPGGVWYTYTPDVDRVFFGSATVNTGVEGFVSAYAGACGSLTPVGCPDPNAFFQTPPTLSAGVTYSIFAGIHPGANVTEIPYGTTLSVHFDALIVPGNDTCAGATGITQNPASILVQNAAAGPDLLDPSCAGLDGQFNNAVWYRLSTLTAGTLSVAGLRTPESTFFYDPAGVLYSGACGGLSEIACDNPVEGFLVTDHFEFNAELAAGQTYYLAVGAWRNPVGGDLTLDVGYTGTLDTDPPCTADFNHSGAVSVQDIFDFLAAYFSGSPSADVNGSGAVSVQDIFDYLAFYFAGCP